jgi:hypothetical protein
MTVRSANPVSFMLLLFVAAAHLLTLLAVDLRLHVEVNAGNDKVGHDVECANSHQDVGVLEGHLLRDLHHEPAS